MIKVERFINELMTSNCYIVWDEKTLHCVIIDPGSKESLREIEFVESHTLILDYILLTHEHTDHTWGVNALLDKYSPEVICSAACRDALPAVGNIYFRLYYDDPNYSYTVKRVDCTIEDLNNEFEWCGHTVEFIPSPGHSTGSICIRIDDCLFSGDTLMQYKLYANKKSGAKQILRQTIERLLNSLPSNLMIHPGHGDTFMVEEYKLQFSGCASDFIKLPIDTASRR